jgi:L-alanine-DL-glutamate epimerase-like enolase superfamily enzyme
MPSASYNDRDRTMPSQPPDRTPSAASLYARLADLPLLIEEHAFEALEQTVPSGWSRTTTVIHLRGGGHEGCGEDVTWNDEDHRRLHEDTAFELAGRHTLDGFSRRLDELELFPQPPSRSDYPLYRRWGFESAALDLALQQAGTSLADALGMAARPLNFVVSTGLGEPARTDALCERLDTYPGMRFKLDLSESWTPELVAELAELGVVDTVDLKGLYHGADFSGPPADPEQYRAVAEGLTDCWIEDPLLNDDTRAALEGHLDRVTWDANLHSLADIVALPSKPRCVNIKPSRFGFLSELLRIYEYCRGQGIAMYAGGQFELGIGREQAQYLASVFHPDAGNDIAPLAYNRPKLERGLPTSPLEARPAARGFRWQA